MRVFKTVIEYFINDCSKMIKQKKKKTVFDKEMLLKFGSFSLTAVLVA